MAKPNYGFLKRQKELAKQKKKEEKRKRKLERNQDDSAPENVEQDGLPPSDSDPGTTPDPNRDA